MSYRADEIEVALYSPTGRPIGLVVDPTAESSKVLKEAVLEALRARIRRSTDEEELRVQNLQKSVLAPYRSSLSTLIGVDSLQRVCNLIEKYRDSNFGLHFLMCGGQREGYLEPYKEQSTRAFSAVKEELKKVKVESNKLEELRRRVRGPAGALASPASMSKSTPSPENFIHMGRKLGTPAPGLRIALTNVTPPNLTQSSPSCSNFFVTRPPYSSWFSSTSWNSSGTDTPIVRRLTNVSSGKIGTFMCLTGSSGSLDDYICLRSDEAVGFYFAMPFAGHLEVYVRTRVASSQDSKYVVGVLEEWPTSLCDMTMSCDLFADVIYVTSGSDGLPTTTHLETTSHLWHHHAWSNPERATHFAKDGLCGFPDTWWMFNSTKPVPQGTVLFISAGISVRNTVAAVHSSCWNNSTNSFHFSEFCVRVNRAAPC